MLAAHAYGRQDDKIFGNLSDHKFDETKNVLHVLPEPVWTLSFSFPNILGHNADSSFVAVT